jgi:hypothetical protein
LDAALLLYSIYAKDVGRCRISFLTTSYSSSITNVWWDWLVAPVLMVRYKEKSHLAAPSITIRLIWMDLDKKEIELVQDGGQIKRQRTSITRVQFLSFATFPIPLISHWSLPIIKQSNRDVFSIVIFS